MVVSVVDGACWTVSAPAGLLQVREHADWRNVGFLARFVSETGRIVPRRRTGLQVIFGLHVS